MEVMVVTVALEAMEEHMEILEEPDIIILIIQQLQIDKINILMKIIILKTIQV